MKASSRSALPMKPPKTRRKPPMKEPPDPGGHSGDDQTPIGDPPSKRGPKRLLTHEADRRDPPYGKARVLSFYVRRYSQRLRRKAVADSPLTLTLSPQRGEGNYNGSSDGKNLWAARSSALGPAGVGFISQSASKIRVLNVLSRALCHCLKSESIAKPPRTIP
jgi:hypothetical protein